MTTTDAPTTHEAVPGLPLPAPFVLWRHKDPDSGEGLVATGVRWPNGWCSMRWQCAVPPAGYDRPVHQVAWYECAQDMLAVHGQDGGTQMVLRDPLRVHTDLELRLFALVTPGSTPPMQWVESEPAVMFWGVVWTGGPAVTCRSAYPVPTRSGRPVPERVALWPGGMKELHLYHDGLESGVVSVVPLWLPEQAYQLPAPFPAG